MLLQIQQNLRHLQGIKRLVVGVSGGADSVCLALILKEFGYEIILAHLNHGLRGRESDEDAKFVKKLAERLRVPCIALKTVIPTRGNLENNARLVRYAFLEDVRRRLRADAIAMAHHRDDQVETILMHLVRGAGLRGIAGMKFKTGRIIRPLLEVSKREILNFLKKRGQVFCHDPSNENLNFLRNRLRHMIIPHFQKENPSFKEEILDISLNAARELTEVNRRAKNWLKINCDDNRFSRENFSLLEPTVKGEVIIELLGTCRLYGKHIHRLIRLIERGKSGRQMTLRGIAFRIEYDQVRLVGKKTKKLSQKTITTSGIKWGSWNLKKQGRFQLFVRSWQPGDRFVPAGMQGTKKVQDYFTDAKIPRTERDQFPIIVNRHNEILAIGDRRLSKKGKNLKLNRILKIMSLLILGFSLVFPTRTLAQEVAERTVIEEVPSGLNIILRWPSAGSRWLLKLKPGCPTLQANQTVRLGVRGDLNGKNDYLDIGSNRRCDIQAAYEFNELLTVNSTNRNRADVTDEQGKKWTLFAEESCGNLTNFPTLYAFRAGPRIAKGDTIYLHGGPKKCPLKQVEPMDEEGSGPVEEPTHDIQAPTQVTHVRAIPRNGKAFVYWRSAHDNLEVDHYVVSYSHYPIDPRHMTFDSAENKQTAKNTRLTVENLRNDRDYYFYVMAVDAEGNRSSLWSESAHARVSSSISLDLVKQTGQRQLNLHRANESENFFLFKWDAPPTTTRFLISVTADGKPLLVIHESPQKSLRVLKLPARAGKRLLLEVSAFNLRGFIEQEKIEFGF